MTIVGFFRKEGGGTHELYNLVCSVCYGSTGWRPDKQVVKQTL